MDTSGHFVTGKMLATMRENRCLVKSGALCTLNDGNGPLPAVRVHSTNHRNVEHS
jgi:hypothetical protein